MSHMLCFYPFVLSGEIDHKIIDETLSGARPIDQDEEAHSIAENIFQPLLD